jgi:RNA polymerase sigma-70 factor, ECF subfamily
MPPKGLGAIAPSGQRGCERDRLHDDHAKALRGFALRLCRSQIEADDLVQETLLRALAAWAHLMPGTNTRSWLLSILHHLFVDRCRRSKLEGVQLSVEAFAPRLPAPEREAEPTWARLEVAEVERAVDTLAPPFRDVYRLHAAGRSYDEIASALGIPRATVGTRLRRARGKLKTIFFGTPA